MHSQTEQPSGHTTDAGLSFIHCWFEGNYSTWRFLTVSAMPVWRRADHMAASPWDALKGSRLSLTVPEKTTGSCTHAHTDLQNILMFLATAPHGWGKGGGEVRSTSGVRGPVCCTTDARAHAQGPAHQYAWEPRDTRGGGGGGNQQPPGGTRASLLRS